MYQKLKKDSAYKYVHLDHCDSMNPYRPEYHGTFELEFEVGGRMRRMLAYAPEDIRDSTAGLIVVGPNGVTADELLEHSGWREIADSEECKEKLIVFFVEPENGVWKTEEPYGTPDGDVAYLNAAAITAAERYLFCVHESKVYLTGAREGGVMAHMEAAWNPAFFAGIATVGGSAVSPEYLRAAGEDYCLNLDGYEDPTHRKGIRKGEIPMPAWIIDDPTVETGTGSAILRYWRTACGTEETPRQLRFDQVEYYRTAETEYPLNQEKEAYRVCYSSIEGASAEYAKMLQRRIWKDFLYRQRRWMSCPGGDLRVTRDPVRDLGMEYHYEVFDGWMREWYVYLPQAVKDNPQKKVPLVFAMHGYTCTGEIYIGNSGWHEVADRYGFIVVFPSALHGIVSMPDNKDMVDWALLGAWNVLRDDDRPDELRFFEHMLDKMIAEYPVDENSVFATGHSWGSVMTEMLALGITDRLAAVAPCSGVLFNGIARVYEGLPQMNPYNGKQLPIWMLWGLEETWLIDQEPDHDNDAGITIELWLKKNHMEEQIPEDWSTCTGTVNGRFIDHEFTKQGCAPVRFTQVDYMPHATMPEMSFRIWEEFFSRYVKE